MSKRVPAGKVADATVLPGLHALSLKGESVGRCGSLQRNQLDETEDWSSRVTKKSRDLFSMEIPADGSCLFHSIAALLPAPTIEAPEDGIPNRVRSGEFDNINGDGVRAMVTTYIRNNWQYFANAGLELNKFFQDQMENESDRDFVNRYADYMERLGVYGGHTEIEAAAEVFNCNIVVLQLDNASSTVTHFLTESPCSLLKEDSEMGTKGTIEFGPDGDYKELTFSETMQLDTIIVMRVLLFNQITENFVPHYSAITYNSPEAKRKIVRLAHPEDIVTDSNSDKAVKNNPDYFSYALEREYAKKIAERLTCGGPPLDFEEWLPAELLFSLIQSANTIVSRQRKRKRGESSNSSEIPTP